MDGGRPAGLIVRAVRVHAGLRQEDLADRAGVSQRWVSELELGRIEHLSPEAISRICEPLDIVVRLDLWWRGGDVDRLLDRNHATIVEYVVRRLRRLGWEVRVEYTFNHYGDRGSVDILAWHAATRTLLIIEVKGRITDLQEMLGTLEKKVRVVPGLVSRDGWAAERVGTVLVVLGTTANHRVVNQHPEVFRAAFPARAREAVRWLRRPDRPLRALWMVPTRTVAGDLPPQRVRRSREPLPPEP